MDYVPRRKRAKYKAPILVVPSMTAVATKFKSDAVHKACRRPSLELKGPMSSEPTNVPMVISEDINCCTVGSMAHL